MSEAPTRMCGGFTVCAVRGFTVALVLVRL